MSITLRKKRRAHESRKRALLCFFTQKIEHTMIIESLRRELVRETGPERA